METKKELLDSLLKEYEKQEVIALQKNLFEDGNPTDAERREAKQKMAHLRKQIKDLRNDNGL